MRKYLPLLATVVVIAINAAANIVPINGINTGEVSALYPTGFTPAGWVFAMLGPWVLTWLLLQFGEGLGLSTDLLLFLALTVAVATPCWPAPVSAMIRVLPMRFARRIWPIALLILCAPV